jgi:hypothetical protein
MKLKESDIKEKYVNILTTKKVDEILNKMNHGEKLHLTEKIWFNNEVGVRRAKLQFAQTRREIEEYTKCKMNIQYFAEKYCKIKREDGTIGPMQLRDYQKQIIDLFTKNSYSILMASRQTGKCNSLISRVLIKELATNKMIETTLGELYYSIVKTERKLTFIETTKLLLYKMLKYL